MEMVDKFNNKRQPLNKVTERYEHIDGEYRQAVHVWIINDEGNLLFQKRAETKRSFPGLWSVTGGGVDTGETTLDALYRETKEELGVIIEPENVELMMSFKVKRTFTDIYLVRQNIDINSLILQKEEVSDAKYIKYSAFQNMINEGIVAPNVAFYAEIMYKLINIDESKI